MEKIRDCKENKNGKMKLRVLRVILASSLMLTSTFLTGCHRLAADVMKSIKSITLNDNAGVIKNGNELIPFYYEERIDCENYHSLTDGIFIGDEVENEFANVVNHYGKVLYAIDTQVIYFGESYPNVYCDYEVISNFDANVYQKYADNYLENVATFDRSLINVYELESLMTDEKKTVVGYKVSNTQIFNFETYMVEDYSGWNANCILDGNTLEQNSFMYNEVLDLLEQYRCDTLALELK